MCGRLRPAPLEQHNSVRLISWVAKHSHHSKPHTRLSKVKPFIVFSSDLINVNLEMSATVLTSFDGHRFEKAALKPT